MSGVVVLMISAGWKLHHARDIAVTLAPRGESM